MPIIAYKCSKKACQHEFDVFYTSQSAREAEEPKEKCPKCGSTRKKKQVSKGTGFVLNGDGWYKKHYG